MSPCGGARRGAMRGPSGVASDNRHDSNQRRLGASSEGRLAWPQASSPSGHLGKPTRPQGSRVVSRRAPGRSRARASGAVLRLCISRRKERLVAEVGLEPTHSCEYRILNPARLPIPPLGRGGRSYSSPRQRCIPYEAERSPVVDALRRLYGVPSLGSAETGRGSIHD